MSVTRRSGLRVMCFMLACCGLAQAAERPTLNHTRDPRPDILPHPFYNAHTEYRARYNRPRKVPGWIVSWIAPTSQEAMVWEENYMVGNYQRHHMPPLYKRFFFPKPWEVLNTGARPDFSEDDEVEGYEAYESDVPRRPENLEDIEGVPQPLSGNATEANN